MFRYGVDYYPEQWPQERWATDARLMQEAGINTVRLAEFAWSRLEPHEGAYDFDWLDRALATLGERGIQAVLGTPTASPPPWLMEAYPECYRVSEDGRRATFGNRREYCPTVATYREFSRYITAAMAEHYAGHPSIIGWQTDNEFSGRCYCGDCRRAFQVWLRAKYGTLEALNAAWGTIFWSHVYTEWSQVPLPLKTGGVPNPGLELDYKRFMSDAFVAFQQEQVDILRATCPDHFVTHNFMGFGFDELNYYDLARPLDFVTWDNYPRYTGEPNLAYVALAHDTMRGLKRQSFWVMEEQCGNSGWRIMGVTPRPGEIRLWSWQAVAHGADAVVYFRWRTARFGTEQYWHGVLQHHGKPGRRYFEVKQTGEELARLADALVGAETRAEVALLLDYDTRFAFQGQPNQQEFVYADYFHSWHAAFLRQNVAIDIVEPGQALGRYKLVVAPAAYVMPQDLADGLRHFVDGGGVLVVTLRSGVKDKSNTVVDTELPGPLADVCGVTVEEYDPQPLGEGNRVAFSDPALTKLSEGAPVRVWCDVLAPRGAAVVATYAQRHYAGEPAITVNRFGKGRAVYVGALGDASLHEPLAAWLLEIAGVAPLLATPPGVEATARWQGEERLLFLLNYSGEPKQVALPAAATDLLSGERLGGTVDLPPYGVMVLK